MDKHEARLLLGELWNLGIELNGARSELSLGVMLEETGGDNYSIWYDHGLARLFEFYKELGKLLERFDLEG